jgi:hypothetical protein
MITNDRHESVGFPVYVRDSDAERCDYRPQIVSLPDVRKTVTLGWHRHLPVEAGITFTSIAVLTEAGCVGQEMWDLLERWHRQAQRYKPDAEQACAKEDVERRFNAEYGKPWRKTLKGLVALLVDLGLVIRDKDKNNADRLRIPHALPLPEHRLNLSEAEKLLLKEMRMESGYHQA